MKISFDREADALYIQFQSGKIKHTRKVADGVMVDIAKDGRVFGIEILDASRRIPRRQLSSVLLNISPSQPA